MKKTFTILGLIIAMAIQGQNWSPILPGEKMNYRHSDSANITNTIWVRLTQIVSGDTLFRFNKVVIDDPDNPDNIIRNQYQFLSSYVKKQGLGYYHFASPLNYFLPVLTGSGSTWYFTSTITAEITEITVEDVFGVQDSVKTISLSDGNEIRLSKGFGILKFPDFENGGYYELVGIQDSGYGENVPGFWEIFDFEPGDVQQRLYYHDYPNYSHQHITKALFNSKEIFDDHITYNVYELISGYNYYEGNGYVYFTDIYEGERVYYKDNYEWAGKFQDELILLQDYPYCSPIYDDDFLFARITTYPDANDIKTKHWGKYNYNSEGLYYETSPSSDILTALPPVNCMSEGPHGMTYKASLGISAKYRADFESEDYYYLMGYVKDGITVGTVYDDSYFITGIKHQSESFGNYMVYPNPAKNWLYFKPESLGNGITYGIRLLDIFGQLIREEKEIRSSLFAMDISGLKSGVYFYEIEESSGNVQKGKFIVK